MILSFTGQSLLIDEEESSSNPKAGGKSVKVFQGKLSSPENLLQNFTWMGNLRDRDSIAFVSFQMTSRFKLL